MVRGKIDPRGKKRRNENPIILIVTEGAQTERKYFEHFNGGSCNKRITVIPNKGNSDTDYESLLIKAKKQKLERELSAQKGDSIWIVADIDVDWNTPLDEEKKKKQLCSVRSKAAQSGIKLAISNPCFELWFLLHYEYTTASLKNYDEVKKKLERYIPDYEKAKDVYDMLSGKMNIAVRNAERLEEYHLHDGKRLPLDVESIPFTEIFRLIEEIKEVEQHQNG